MLDVRKLNVVYGDVQVLLDVELNVQSNEIVTVIGANGAGKSTLIKSISGLISSSPGTLKFSNVDLTTLRSHDVVALGIVQVPEGRHIFPEMTVLENLRMGSYLPRARQLRAQNLERVFSLFPRIGERQKQLGGTLSGGEQQMLAIARGLMADPKLMLLDEPSLGLSPVLVEQIFEIIGEIRRQGISVLLVEQNVSRSLQVADRAYVLETGRIVLKGSGRELRNHALIKSAFLGHDFIPDFVNEAVG